MVPTNLEGAAMRLLNNGTRVVTVSEAPSQQVMAAQNEWAGTVRPVVSPWLS